MPNRIWCFVFSTALAGCTPFATRPSNTNPPDSVVPEIARQFRACNVDALMENYSDNMEFVSPSTPNPIVDHAEARNYFSDACQRQVRAIMWLETQRVRVLSAESAVITGTHTFGRTSRSNDNTPWTAFLVMALKQTNGRWLVDTHATFPVPES